MIETIDRHMVADVPVSTFLSGGLDSSVIILKLIQKSLKSALFWPDTVFHLKMRIQVWYIHSIEFFDI